MATKNERLDLVRNIIAELDREIKTAESITEMIETSGNYEGELQEALLQDWISHTRTLKNLRNFVIYKA